MDPRTRIALIGIGNEFRHDDGVGPAVVEELRRCDAERPLPPGVACDTCDGDPARLIGLWHDTDLAVGVDATHAYPGHPGRVTRLELDAEHLARPTDGHAYGRVLREAVELSRMLGRLPRRLVVYAVQGADSSLGTGLSPSVAAVVEPIAGSVEDEITHHQATAGDRGPGTTGAPWAGGRRPEPVHCSPLPRPEPGRTIA